MAFLTPAIRIRTILDRDGAVERARIPTKVRQLIYTSRILLLLAVCLSKCTVFLFIRNLFTHETYGTWRACNIFSALTLCWGVASVLIVGVGCPSTHLLSQPARTCASEVRVAHRVTTPYSLTLMPFRVRVGPPLS